MPSVFRYPALVLTAVLLLAAGICVGRDAFAQSTPATSSSAGEESASRVDPGSDLGRDGQSAKKKATPTPGPTATPPPGGPCGTKTTPPATFDHVIWLWMEN